MIFKKCKSVKNTNQDKVGDRYTTDNHFIPRRSTSIQNWHASKFSVNVPLKYLRSES